MVASWLVWFEETMVDLTDSAKDRFYVDNFADLMGAGLGACTN